MMYVKNVFGCRASLWYLIFGKKLMVLRSAVPEILGGWFPSQILLSCQKEQMLLTVSILEVGFCFELPSKC